MSVKQSGVMRLIEKMRAEEFLRYDAKLRKQADLYKQVFADIGQIAHRESLEEDGGSIESYVSHLGELYKEFCEIWNADAKDRIYAITKLDQRLREVCGDAYDPIEKRYEGLT